MHVDDILKIELRSRRFGGVARLYGDAALQRFAHARIAVVGIGGVGSWAAEALARSGVGALRLIDLDHVAESNVNRQLHALDGEIGRAKVEVMAERIARIDPGCDVDAIDDHLTPENCAALLARCDAVLDAVDDTQAKCAIALHARRTGCVYIACGAAGGKRDATAVRLSDLAGVRHDALLARLRSRLRREHGYPKGGAKMGSVPMNVPCVFVDTLAATAPQACEPGAPLNCAGYGSVMHMTAAVGLAAAGYVLDRLANM